MTKNEVALIKESVLIIMEDWVKNLGHITMEDLRHDFPMMLFEELESIRKLHTRLPYSGIER